MGSEREFYHDGARLRMSAIGSLADRPLLPHHCLGENDFRWVESGYLTLHEQRLAHGRRVDYAIRVV